MMLLLLMLLGRWARSLGAQAVAVSDPPSSPLSAVARGSSPLPRDDWTEKNRETPAVPKKAGRAPETRAGERVSAVPRFRRECRARAARGMAGAIGFSLLCQRSLRPLGACESRWERDARGAGRTGLLCGGEQGARVTRGLGLVLQRIGARARVGARARGKDVARGRWWMARGDADARRAAPASRRRFSTRQKTHTQWSVRDGGHQAAARARRPGRRFSPASASSSAFFPSFFFPPAPTQNWPGLIATVLVALSVL